MAAEGVETMHIIDGIMDQYSYLNIPKDICIRVPDNWESKDLPTAKKIMTPTVLQSFFQKWLRQNSAKKPKTKLETIRFQ